MNRILWHSALISLCIFPPLGVGMIVLAFPATVSAPGEKMDLLQTTDPDISMERIKNKKKQLPSWPDVKTVLARLNQTDLLDLISDLYHLSNNNQDFLHARLTIGDDIVAPYKKIIEECMYPDILNGPVRIHRAIRAISDFSKAICDAKDKAELLTYFVECGNKFTLDYGDIDEDFYDSLMEVYGQAINKVLTLPDHEQGNFKKRLKKIMISSNGIGWGYHDSLCDDYYEAFQDDE
jgi:hypothetical protein